MMNEIRQWMHHSLRLTEEMVKFARKHPDRADRKALGVQLESMRRVMYAIQLGKVYTLQMDDQVWYAYMYHHARAEIRRYAHECSEAEFFAECARLRRIRDAKLVRLSESRRAA